MKIVVNRMKKFQAVIREKIIVLNTFVSENERNNVNNLTSQLRKTS